MVFVDFSKELADRMQHQEVRIKRDWIAQLLEAWMKQKLDFPQTARAQKQKSIVGRIHWKVKVKDNFNTQIQGTI